MKKYLFIIAAAATCLLVACSKEKELRAPETTTEETTTKEFVRLPGWTYISATGGETETAAIINDNAEFRWATGDTIAIFANGTYQKSAPLDASFNDSASAEFAFEGVNAYRSDFAVYPASLVFKGNTVRGNSVANHTTTALTITLPASYKLADVQDTKSVTPMIAANEPDGTLAFKSICALLRITVKNIPKDAYTLKVSFPGKKVKGEFTLSNFTVGTDGVQAVTSTSEAEETITITDLGISAFNANGLVINVPAPIGKISDDDYPYVRVGAYDMTDHKINSIDTPIKTVKDENDKDQPVAWNPSRLTSRKVTAKLPYFTTNTKTSKKVVFAPGNLVATLTSIPADGTIGSAKDFRFAEHQYDALGNCVGNRFAGINNPVDLFAWIGASATGTFDDDQKWGIVWPNNSADATIGNVGNEYIKWDWGEIFNGVTYPAGTWRLPNKDKSNGEASVEWARLTVGREGSYNSCKVTLIHENAGADADTVAHGLVIFPDGYSQPYGMIEFVNSGKGKANQSNAHYVQNIITFEQWEVLEKVGGCVFLPATNCRIRSGGANLSTYLADGAYWVNSANNYTQSSAAMVFSDAFVCNKSLNGNGTTSLQDSKSVQRKNGCAVRLIRDVN